MRRNLIAILMVMCSWSVVDAQVMPWPVDNNEADFLDRTFREVLNRTRQRLDSNGLVHLHSSYVDTSVGLWFTGMVRADTIKVTDTGVTKDMYLLSSVGIVHIKALHAANGNGQIRLYEKNDNGGNFVTVWAPLDLAGDVFLTLPDNDGDAGEFMNTDGSGNMDWSTPVGLWSKVGDTLIVHGGATLRSDGHACDSILLKDTGGNVVAYSDPDSVGVTVSPVVYAGAWVSASVNVDSLGAGSPSVVIRNDSTWVVLCSGISEAPVVFYTVTGR